jgi:hypothetical protein
VEKRFSKYTRQDLFLRNFFFWLNHFKWATLQGIAMTGAAAIGPLIAKEPFDWKLLGTIIAVALLIGGLMTGLIAAFFAGRRNEFAELGWYGGKMYYDAESYQVKQLIEMELATKVMVDGGPYGPFETIELTPAGLALLETYERGRAIPVYMRNTYDILCKLAAQGDYATV